MRRGIPVFIVVALLGVALLQEGTRTDAALEINTSPQRAFVSVSGPDGFVALLDVTGPELLDGLPPGTYFIAATAQGYAAEHAEVDLESGEAVAVRLDLQPVAGRQPVTEEEVVAEADRERPEEAEEAEEPEEPEEAEQPEEPEEAEDAEQPDGQQQDGGGQQQDGQQQDGHQDGQQQDGDGQQQDGQQYGQQQEGDGQQQDAQQPDGQQAGDKAAAGQGADIYASQCAQCHGSEGGGGVGPPLAGNDELQDPEDVIRQILRGGGGMPAFADQLSNEEIAAVATFEMTSWGNDYGEVTAERVQQLRNE